MLIELFSIVFHFLLGDDDLLGRFLFVGDCFCVGRRVMAAFFLGFFKILLFIVLILGFNLVNFFLNVLLSFFFMVCGWLFGLF